MPPSFISKIVVGDYDESKFYFFFFLSFLFFVLLHAKFDSHRYFTLVYCGIYFFICSSVFSSAQQVPRFTLPSTSPSFVSDNAGNHLQDAEYLHDMRDIYAETDTDAVGLDVSRRSSDLYSPELNLEAHRTAQEVLLYIIYFSVLILG